MMPPAMTSTRPSTERPASLPVVAAVVLTQALLGALLAGAIGFAIGDPGPHGYPILIIAMPSFVLIPALALGLVRWLFAGGRTLMLLSNAPIALFAGWLLGASLTADLGPHARWDLVAATGVAFACAVIGLYAAWRLRAPRLGARRGPA
jgi:hypothetical protein